MEVAELTFSDPAAEAAFRLGQLLGATAKMAILPVASESRTGQFHPRGDDTQQQPGLYGCRNAGGRHFC